MDTRVYKEFQRKKDDTLQLPLPPAQNENEEALRGVGFPKKKVKLKCLKLSFLKH